MIGLLWIRLIFLMASHAIGKQPAAGVRPTTYYFAYGSNLHLKQMKKRCPTSKYVGRAQLLNYRWQINQRGYANVVKAEGRVVEGLVFEITPLDEARLDINEGVSKNAYAKQNMTVHLHRADSCLYRRPTAWIVNKGGPVQARRFVKEAVAKTAEHAQYWQQKVLVYISLNYVKDSPPKEEYVDRINLGLVDAKALGMDEAYVGANIRPFVPERLPNLPGDSNPQAQDAAAKKQGPANGIKRTAPGANGERPPVTSTPGPQPSQKLNPQAPAAGKMQSSNNNNMTPIAMRRASVRQLRPPLPPRNPTTPPPLPPRPKVRLDQLPTAVAEEIYLSARYY
jgi:gamma-glutamylcyclotransferase (GGCT)/AIG2-like uncharacterized protein YtfP